MFAVSDTGPGPDTAPAPATDAAKDDDDEEADTPTCAAGLLTPNPTKEGCLPMEDNEKGTPPKLPAPGLALEVPAEGEWGWGAADPAAVPAKGEPSVPLAPAAAMECANRGDAEEETDEEEEEEAAAEAPAREGELAAGTAAVAVAEPSNSVAAAAAAPPTSPR
jgi:hypothetical protein